jgi:hypothetical protein
MDQKAGQAIGARRAVWVGYPLRRVGGRPSLAHRSAMVSWSVFSPRANSDLTLFRSNAASKRQGLIVIKGVAQYCGQALCGDLLADLSVAPSDVPGNSAPAGEQLKVSVAWGVPQAPLRACKKYDLREHGTTSKVPDCTLALEISLCCSRNISSGKMLLAGSKYRGGGKISNDYVHRVEGLLLEAPE